MTFPFDFALTLSVFVLPVRSILICPKVGNCLGSRLGAGFCRPLPPARFLLRPLLLHAVIRYMYLPSIVLLSSATTISGNTA